MKTPLSREKNDIDTKEKPLNMQVAEKIKEIRKKKKLTQLALGQLLGLTQNAIKNFERGRIPKAPVLSRLAKIGGVSVDWILGLEVHESPAFYGGLDQKKKEIVDELAELLSEADENIGRDIRNYVALQRHAAKTPKRRASGED